MIPFVRPMLSTRSGKPVPNQYIIHTSEGTYFQSYKTIIGFRPRGQGTTILDRDSWNCSVTTRKYLHIWLRGHGDITAKELVAACATEELNND